jgi:undecaprenyl-diphosphatase
MSLPDLALALLLGLVEGLTEFVPVSSTGHLILVGNALGFTGQKAATFEIVIQLGAILAVVALYRKRLFGGIWNWNATGFRGFQGWKLLAVASVPSVILGATTHDYIKENLFSPATVAAALAAGAILILVVERRHKPLDHDLNDNLDSLTWVQALAVGMFQCLALWPGMSRSAATIIGGLIIGLGRRTAVEFSFLAAVPVMMAATVYDLYKTRDLLQVSDIPFFAVGFIAAFLTAALAVKILPIITRSITLSPFAWYRIGVAALVWWMLT